MGVGVTQCEQCTDLPEGDRRVVAIGAILLAFVYPAEASVSEKAMQLMAGGILTIAGSALSPAAIRFPLCTAVGLVQSVDAFKVMETKL